MEEYNGMEQPEDELPPEAIIEATNELYDVQASLTEQLRREMEELKAEMVTLESAMVEWCAAQQSDCSSSCHLPVVPPSTCSHSHRSNLKPQVRLSSSRCLPCRAAGLPGHLPVYKSAPVSLPADLSCWHFTARRSRRSCGRSCRHLDPEPDQFLPSLLRCKP